MKELKITKEKVLEASESYPDAKGVLKTLFPEAFKKEKGKWVNVTEEIRWCCYNFEENEERPGEYWIMGVHEGDEVFFFNVDGLKFNLDNARSEYKIEERGGRGSFCILKKE